MNFQQQPTQHVFGDDSDGSAYDDPWYFDLDNMSDAQLRKYHRIWSKKGNGWFHGFDRIDRREDPIDGNISHVSFVCQPRRQIIKLFTRENWQRMGEDISKSTMLSTLYFNKCGLEEEVIVALFGEEGRTLTYISPPDTLVLEENPLGPGGFAALAPFLKSTPVLTYLNICRVDLGAEGARLLADALNHTHIRELLVGSNGIGDDGVDHLFSALKSSQHLMILNLGENGVGRRGFDLISQFLIRDDTTLERLHLICESGDCAKMMIDSISNKSKLVELSFGDDVFISTNDDPVAAFLLNVQKKVCNLSSYEALCQPNHQLNCIGVNTNTFLELNPNLQITFDINARVNFGASITKRLRCKLRTLYLKGDFDVEPFAAMKVNLIPYVLELVTKTELRVNTRDELGSGNYYEVPSDDLDGIYHMYGTAICLKCSVFLRRRLEYEGSRREMES